MGFKPTVAAESRRAANGNSFHIAYIGGQWQVAVTIMTTNGQVTQTLSQAEIIAATTGAERTNTQSLLGKLQNAALTKAGWVDDTNPDPP